MLNGLGGNPTGDARTSLLTAGDECLSMYRAVRYPPRECPTRVTLESPLVDASLVVAFIHSAKGSTKKSTACDVVKRESHQPLVQQELPIRLIGL